MKGFSATIRRCSDCESNQTTGETLLGSHQELIMCSRCYFDRWIYLMSITRELLILMEKSIADGKISSEIEVANNARQVALEKFQKAQGQHKDILAIINSGFSQLEKGLARLKRKAGKTEAADENKT